MKTEMKYIYQYSRFWVVRFEAEAAASIQTEYLPSLIVTQCHQQQLQKQRPEY